VVVRCTWRRPVGTTRTRTAKERARKRSELLAATEVLLGEVKAAVERERRPLRGQDKIGLRAGKIVNKLEMAKHFELTMTDDSFAFSRKDDNIELEAALDGFYVVRASAPHTEDLSAAQLVGAYKDLKFNVSTGGARITEVAVPTPLQRRAFDLIGAPVPTELKAM
jgi:hypothetical protein